MNAEGALTEEDFAGIYAYRKLLYQAFLELEDLTCMQSDCNWWLKTNCPPFEGVSKNNFTCHKQESNAPQAQEQ